MIPQVKGQNTVCDSKKATWACNRTSAERSQNRSAENYRHAQEVEREQEMMS